MSINTKWGGLAKPIKKKQAILYYAEASDYETLNTELDTTEDVSSITGLTSAGAITTDGMTIAANADEPETYQDFNGNVFDSQEATSSPQLSFALLEYLSTNAAKLVFKNVQGNEDEEFEEISDLTPPTPKLLVLEFRVKGKKVRIICPECSFATREDEEISNDELISYGVTYNLLADPKRKVFDVA